jgi:2-dehydropantoate 2-reductase
MANNSILIVGTGALSTLFAARLSAAGISVTMLGSWLEGLTALKNMGARVVGEQRAFTVRATNEPSECKGIQFALVLVKSWQTERIAWQLQSCLPENGLVLTLQNGLGNNTILGSILGMDRVVQGVTTLGATLISPGLVRPGGDGPVTIESHSRLSKFVDMFLRAGFLVNKMDDIRTLVWGKLVISSAINPLTALLRINNGQLLDSSFSKFLMKEMTRESAMVAKSFGITLPFPDPERAAQEVAQKTALNQSSMLQDILRGAPTEIDAINGAIVRIAEQNNLQVPYNRMALSLIKAIPVRGKIKIETIFSIFGGV